MANFKSPSDVMADFIADYKAITGIELDPNDVSREEVIKMKTYSGPISLFYSALQRVEDGIFPESASDPFLRKHLRARQIPDQFQPGPSQGTIVHTGDPGTPIPIGNVIKAAYNGALYQSIAAAVIGEDGTVPVTYQSSVAGQAYNIAQLGLTFTQVGTVDGLDSSSTNSSQFANGRNLEDSVGMLERIEDHDRTDDTGGNLAAYERLAKAASSLVVKAKAIKVPRGPNTVNTVITSGTTDIEAAVRAGNPVVRIPSSELLNLVQAFIVANNPTTDDHQTIGPTEDAKNVTITYSLYDEELRPTVDVEINLITQIFLYSAVSGDVLNPAQLERLIDQSVGHLIPYRRVSDLGVGSPLFTVPDGKLLIPGTITAQAPS